MLVRCIGDECDGDEYCALPTAEPAKNMPAAAAAAPTAADSGISSKGSDLNPPDNELGDGGVEGPKVPVYGAKGLEPPQVRGIVGDAECECVGDAGGKCVGDAGGKCGGNAEGECEGDCAAGMNPPA